MNGPRRVFGLAIVELGKNLYCFVCSWPKTLTGRGLKEGYT